MNNKKVWMGFGLYTQYIDWLPRFTEGYKDCEVCIAIIADQLQHYNVELNSYEIRNDIECQLLQGGKELEKKYNNFQLKTWSYLSDNKEYCNINDHVDELYRNCPLFQHKARKITSSKTKIPLSDERIEKLVGYTLEEIASIYFFARQGYIKVGHSREKVYDQLASEFAKEANISLSQDKFRYFP